MKKKEINPVHEVTRWRKHILPPIPVFNEHLETYLNDTAAFQVLDADTFEVAKEFAIRGVSLEVEIEEAWRPFREVVEPILQRRLDTLNQLRDRIKKIDSAATGWKRQQDSLKEAELEKARKDELDRRTQAREALLREAELKKQLAEEWGGTETVPEPPPVVEPRRAAVKSEYTYRKGARTKAKLVAVLIDPSAVKPEFRAPDVKLIELTVKNYGKLIHHSASSGELLRELEEKIGGVLVKWEEP